MAEAEPGESQEQSKVPFSSHMWAAGPQVLEPSTAFLGTSAGVGVEAGSPQLRY